MLAADIKKLPGRVEVELTVYMHRQSFTVSEFERLVKQLSDTAKAARSEQTKQTTLANLPLRR